MKNTLLRLMALATLIASFMSGEAMAADCILHITRTACSKDTEKESFSKCAGKASCDEKKKVGSAEACAKEAEKACENTGTRQKITKSKVIKADFDGKPVEGGKNFCKEDRPDFNKCGG